MGLGDGAGPGRPAKNEVDDTAGVRYQMEVIGPEIPGRADGLAAVIRPLRARLDLIEADEKYWRVWISIADYDGSNIATGAMRDLKKKYGGSPAVYGFSFTTNRYSVTEGDGMGGERPKLDEMTGRPVRRCRLLVKYDPDLVDSDEKKKWERNLEVARVSRQAERVGLVDREGGGNGS